MLLLSNQAIIPAHIDADKVATAKPALSFSAAILQHSNKFHNRGVVLDSMEIEQERGIMAANVIQPGRFKFKK